MAKILRFCLKLLGYHQGSPRPGSANAIAIGSGMGNPFGGGNDWFSQAQKKR